MNASTPLAADRFEKALAAGTTLVAALMIAAVLRGHGQWAAIPVEVWFHLGFLLIALALTPIMLLRKRGDRLHRQLGWVWAGAMVITAAISLQVRVINPGQFSPIHILSVAVLIGVPLLVWRARKHQVAAHRRGVRIVVAAGLIIAGLATFPPARLLGRWLFGA